MKIICQQRGCVSHLADDAELGTPALCPVCNQPLVEPAFFDDDPVDVTGTPLPDPLGGAVDVTGTPIGED